MRISESGMRTSEQNQANFLERRHGASSMDIGRGSIAFPH
jgi:hypothetical protein